ADGRAAAHPAAATESVPPYVTALRERLERAARSPEAWRARREEVRTRILVAAGLWPEFERPPLAPVVFGQVEGPDYTIERVDLETLPGFHLTGNLFRPKGKTGPFPAVLHPPRPLEGGPFHAGSRRQPPRARRDVRAARIRRVPLRHGRLRRLPADAAQVRRSRVGPGSARRADLEQPARARLRRGASRRRP